MGTIRVAHTNDCTAIIDFIQREWKSDHIFCLNKDFFLYQYQDKEGLNFIISLSDDYRINGILGFIKASIDNEAAAWASLWKVSSNNGNAMLGLQLMDFLRNMFPNRLFCSGINEKTIPLYQYMGMHTGVLELFVMVNQQMKSYEIGEINSSLKIPVFIKNEDYQLIQLKDDFDYTFDNSNRNVPFKDEDYYIKRYSNHPIYNYKSFGIYCGGSLKAIVVTREQSLNNSKVLRLVDFIGDEKYLKFVSRDLYDLLVRNDYEYVDFICHGFNKQELLNANFIQVDLDSNELIIPNYFSPFIKKNVKINFSADIASLSQLKICKADGDQDRPS